MGFSKLSNSLECMIEYFQNDFQQEKLISFRFMVKPKIPAFKKQKWTHTKTLNTVHTLLHSSVACFFHQLCLVSPGTSTHSVCPRADL